jgi:hypothetical protein
MNKADKVKQAYYDARWDKNYSSEGCYREAVDTALELGGAEVLNSNDGNSSWSYAPSRVFEFDDASSVHITYSAAYA